MGACRDCRGVQMSSQRRKGFYEKYIKRLLDIVCSLIAIVGFSWLYLLIAILVKIKMGSPVLFKQPRPGLIDPKTGKEKIFNMYKFRTMTNERDAEGKLLPDEQRLPTFGRWLRSTSLDGKVIIGTTTETIENTGLREVSPIHFFRGRDLISDTDSNLSIYGGVRLLA